MSKHTPGPWKMNDQGPMVEGSRFTIDSETEKFGQGYWLVATVTRPDDARLIAAAPELLEACKEALRIVNEKLHPASKDLFQQAIAKAEKEV